MAPLYPSSRDYSDLDFTPSGKASQEETNPESLGLVGYLY